MIIDQRFLQTVENIIIRLISDNKGSVITRCLCALSITGNSAGLALTKLQNDHDDYVFTSLKPIACRICVFLSRLF